MPLTNYDIVSLIVKYHTSKRKQALFPDPEIGSVKKRL